MKSQGNKRYNIIAFIVIPLIIIFITLVISGIIGGIFYYSQLEDTEKFKHCESGRLEEEICLDDNTIVYRIWETDTYFIAFKGENLDEIQNTVKILPGGNVLSYWEGNYTEIDIYDYIVNINDIEEYNKYTTYMDKEIRVYDIKDYKGYDTSQGSNFGAFIIITLMLCGGAITLVAELILAFIFKIILRELKGKY